MRTNLVLDDELLNEAARLTGINSKRELVQFALKELIEHHKPNNLFDLAGKIQFDEGFDHKALRALLDDFS